MRNHHPPSRARLFLIPAILSLVAVTTHAGTVTARHRGADSPLQQGWNVTPGDVTSPGELDAGTADLEVGPLFLDATGARAAWGIDDRSTISGSRLRYEQVPDAATLAAAASDGWVLRVIVRVEGSSAEPASSRLIEFSQGPGTTRWGLQFGTTPGGEAIAKIFGDTPTWQSPGGGSAYHRYELSYDVTTGTVDLYVDGKLEIVGASGVSAGSVAARLNFGSGSSGGTGRTHWSLVELDVGATECNDGIDNDGDGLVDAAADSGCDAATDPSESTPDLPCDDGIDQDRDGVADGLDPECSTPTAAGEVDRDLDDDGLTDGAEVLRHGTDPMLADSDGDGLTDGDEVGLIRLEGFGERAPMGDGGVYVEMEDLDGDDDEDLLSADPIRLKWQANVDGLGTFGPPQPIATADTYRRGGVTADLDGDLDLDLLWHDNQGVFLQINASGTGAFAAPAMLLSGYHIDLNVADVDRDGDLDVLARDASTFQTDSIVLVRNLGGGVFATPQTLATGTQTFGVGDFDADGDPDAVGAGEWLRNVGDGTLVSAGTLAGLTSFLDSVDFDGDGDVDVVGRTSETVWFENTDGLGTFAPATPLAPVSGLLDAIEDLDRDGDLDIVWRTLDSEAVWTEVVDGDGTLGATRSIEPGTVVDGTTGDVDGDGVIDVVLGTISPSVGPGWYRTRYSNPLDPDSDDDGLADGEEVTVTGTPVDDADVDDDGLSDGEEVLVRLTDPFDPDSDDDGLADGEEVLTTTTDPLDNDTDDDGLSDGDEVQVHGTNPLAADTDDDGIPDNYEVANGLDPLTDDAGLDPDGDGLDNTGEFTAVTDPFDPDTDDDLLTDGDEVLTTTTDPLDADSDDDGLLDGREVAAWSTDPRTADTDLDGLLDFFEIRHRLDANLDGGEATTDEDGDGLDALAEQAAGSDPRVVDSDDDGLPDGDEVNVHGTDAALADSDGDRLRDGFEIRWGFDPLAPGDGTLDPDGDEADNVAEQAAGTDPFDADSDDDGAEDGPELRRSFSFPLDEREVPVDDEFNFIALPDIDDDGDLDLLVSDFYEAVRWFENIDGRGSFGPERQVPESIGQAIPCDVDGDGDLDLVTGFTTPAWYENTDGMGTFGAPNSISTEDAWTVVPGDVDDDGDVDLLVSSAAQEMSLYLNDGTGGFTAGQALGPGSFPMLVDVDRDRDLDIVFRDGGTTVWLENLEGLGGYWRRHELDPKLFIFAADLDGDRAPEVAVGQNAQRDVLQNDGLGGFPSSVSFPGIIGFEFSYGITDFDRDGDADPFNTHQLIENLGTGFAAPISLTTFSFDNGGVARGDLDGDGDDDLVLDRSSDIGAVDVRLNPSSDPLVADTDGDGLLDGEEPTSSVNLSDTDGDGIGDPAEIANGTDPANPDTDADAIGDGVDNCPLIRNTPQADRDVDGAGDACDTTDSRPQLVWETATRLVWTTDFAYLSFNVYSDHLSELIATGTYVSSSFAERTCGLTEAVLVDAGPPAVGEVRYYLVTGVSGVAESGLGEASDGSDRTGSLGLCQGGTRDE